MERVSNEEAVTVTAECLPPEKSKEQGVSFYLTLNIHSVDPDQYFIRQLSSLAIDYGIPCPAVKWLPSEAFHHFKGVLSFAEELPNENMGYG